MAERLYIGIDGGGTKTTGVLTRHDLTVLAEHTAGPTNLRTVGREPAVAAVRRVLAALRAEAGAAWADVAAVGLCMAGARTDADRAEWARLLDRLDIPGRPVISHDALAALAAGSGDGTGLLAISGTGSLAYGRRRDAAERFAGGRGPLLGDAGSGFDIALRALRAAAGAADGIGEPTVLVELIPRRLGLGGIDELPAWLAPFSPRRVASLAPVVFEAAAGGDAVARQILFAAADALAASAAAVASAHWPAGGFPGRVVLAGGVFRHQETYRGDFLAALTRRGVTVGKCILPTRPAAVGAARVARDFTRGADG